MDIDLKKFKSEDDDFGLNFLTIYRAEFKEALKLNYQYVEKQNVEDLNVTYFHTPLEEVVTKVLIRESEFLFKHFEDKLGSEGSI